MTNDIRAELERLADPKYRLFQSKLLPSVDPSRVLGVRVPELRRLAKVLVKQDPEAVARFMAALPHTSYDEDLLHAILLNGAPGYDKAFARLEAFLPYVDNWAVCDALAPRAFASRPEGLVAQADRWMASDAAFTARFGVAVMMRWYLDADFDPVYLRRVCTVAPVEPTVPAPASGDYYLRMMVAWYVAEALAKQWDAALSVIREQTLPRWTHNKAIQKACESYRVPEEHKALLRGLRV